MTEHHPDRWRATWETGPDAGVSVVLTSAGAVVGRAALADVRCDDPELEPFHARLHVGAGSPCAVQLAGRPPLRATGDRLHIGASTLRFDRIGPAPAPSVSCGMPAPHGAAAGTTVRRTPRPVPTWAPEPIGRGIVGAAPGPPGGGGVLPALVGVAGAGAVAAVTRQPMFVLFGVVGAVVAAVTWIAGRLAYRRARRVHHAAVAVAEERFTSDLAEQCSAWQAFHHAHAPVMWRLLDALDQGAAAVWRRRGDHADAFDVCIGIGDVGFDPAVAAGSTIDDPFAAAASRPVPDQPVRLDLGHGARVAVVGGAAPAVVRAAIVGLAVATGPADWQLVVVTDRPDAWGWARRLPHAADGAGGAWVVTPHDLTGADHDPAAAAGCHTIIVTDVMEQLSMRTAAVRRLLGGRGDAAVVAVVNDGLSVPAICRTVVSTHVDGSSRVVFDAHAAAAPTAFRFVGISATSAAAHVDKLELLRDPEDPRTTDLDIPRAVSLVELLDERGVHALDAGSIAAQWRAAAVEAPPCSPIGRAADGVVDIDLVRDGPHGLIAGTTGAGKSELLRSLVLGMACCSSPEHLTFVVVDYKGGATFDVLAGLPHVVGSVTDLDGRLADRALRSLRAELTHRERTLRDLGAVDLDEARRRERAPVVPRLVVVVDEFAALAAEHPEFLRALVGIAQRGRSLGVHLLLATQRPSGVIDDAIRANTNLRIALRVHGTADAFDVVGDALPASFSRALPGRAVMRLGPDDLVTFQTASSGTAGTAGDGGGDLAARIVRAIALAAAQSGLAPPRRPWLEPLPAELRRADHEAQADHEVQADHEIQGNHAVAIGVIDLPDEQARRQLSWAPADGHLLVVGSPGSGVSSTLRTVALGATTLDPAPVLFVVDASDDGGWDHVAGHPRCAGVVRLHERERLWRLLRRVAAWRRDPGAPAILVVDGIASLRHALESADHAAEADALERVIADADSLGVTLLVGSDTAHRLPPALVARCSCRWVMHLHDPHDGAMLGVPSAAMPGALPGRLAIATLPGHPHAQVVLPDPCPGAPLSRAIAACWRVDRLPVTIRAAEVGLSTHRGGVWHAEIGTRFDDLTALSIDVPDGDHLLVLGPRRSGKSSALAALLVAWSTGADPMRRVATVVVAPRGLALATCTDLASATDEVERQLALGSATMLAVDDADLVHDDSGRLATLIASRPPGLVVVASGRGEALRHAHGHWTAAVRRSRLGLIATGAADTDGDLLGVSLPRSLPVRARPGLVHVVDNGDLVLGQLVS